MITVYPKLAGPGTYRDYPVSTSHLKVVVLELQVYGLLSSFTGVLEDPNCAP